jgi:hypothetical protein
MDQWRFTVRWHRPPETNGACTVTIAWNLFESDLADFEIFTGPLRLFSLHNDEAGYTP